MTASSLTCSPFILIAPDCKNSLASLFDEHILLFTNISIIGKSIIKSNVGTPFNPINKSFTGISFIFPANKFSLILTAFSYSSSP